MLSLVKNFKVMQSKTLLFLACGSGCSLGDLHYFTIGFTLRWSEKIGGHTLPYNFDMDDQNWSKLKQVISKISFPSTMKSFLTLCKLFRKIFREKGRIAFFRYALYINIYIYIYTYIYVYVSNEDFVALSRMRINHGRGLSLIQLLGFT